MCQTHTQECHTETRIGPGSFESPFGFAFKKYFPLPKHHKPNPAPHLSLSQKDLRGAILARCAQVVRK